MGFWPIPLLDINFIISRKFRTNMKIGENPSIITLSLFIKIFNKANFIKKPGNIASIVHIAGLKFRLPFPA